MDPRTEQEISKVERSLDTARSALENEDPESGASRAYYGLYHATVLLLRVVRAIERDRWDHEQLHRAFLDQFCKLGYLFKRQDGEDWADVMKTRFEADYGRTPLTPIQARRTIDRARRLADNMIARIKDYDQTR